MAEKGLFLQNIIAVVWDFDKTLSPHYMQKPLFEAYRIDESRFWKEVRALPEFYARAGVTVQPDTCYLGHLLSYVQAGRMPNLTNSRLRELGERIEFFPGVPEVFASMKASVEHARYRELDIRLEHYVVSTGLAEMIRGSKIFQYLDGVYASEFIEVPAGPEPNFIRDPQRGEISQIASFLDNTTKTRALFEINKGVGREKSISVNDTIPEDERRVPFKNMLYIADGPSDIPSFSVVMKHGGWTCAVYDPHDSDHFEQAASLLQNKRVHYYCESDYRAESATARSLLRQVRLIADRMVVERTKAFASKVGRGPSHSPEGESASLGHEKP
ncbi:MAG: hypothetical protein AMXMBFR84_44310 [Candidatus Hydrogenedentota bacterium]